MATIGRLVSGVRARGDNPLAAILGFTDLLLEKSGDAGGGARRLADYSAGGRKRTKRLYRICELCAAAAPRRRNRVNVNAVLRQTIKLLEPTIFQSHGVEVSEEFEANLSPTLGDAQQLQQVFPEHSQQCLRRDSGIREPTGASGFAHGVPKMMLKWRLWTTGTRSWWTRERIFDPFFTTKQAG